MALNRGIPLVALLSLAVAACSSGGGGTPSSSATASAHAGFGGRAPSAAAPIVVTEVDAEVFFRTPSKNIICELNPSVVRCDILHKSWSPPAKPSSCELDWGNGMYISAGKAAFTCTGDSLISAPSETLEYGHADRSGSVLCTSESSGLTCKDEKSGRGFTLAVSRYSLF